MSRRHLLLLRHAHAEPDAASGRDQDRELTRRGRRDAALVGRFLAAAGEVPDAVLTSPAARARATAEIAVEAAGWRCSVRRIPELYASSVERAIAAVRAHGGEYRTLLLVGHQPTWSELAAALAGGGALRLPKAAVAHLAFDLEGWSGLEPGSGELRALVAPSLIARIVGDDEEH